MDSVTVILSVYKRPYTFDQQLLSIQNQTYENIKILIWANKPENHEIPEYIINNPNTIYSEERFGVWKRFELAKECETKYINIVDDDTIPGSKWIENCINTIKKKKGVITTRGVLANKGKDNMYPLPQSYEAFGWCNPNNEIKQVDIGCHSWFFEKNILSSFWETAPRSIPKNFGEDMHLSYAAQKLGLGTYVAPHPEDDLEMWGSKPDTGNKYGSDENAISWNNEANRGMNYYWNYLRFNDFKIVAEEAK